MRLSKTLRTLLLSIMLVVQCVTCMDLTHNFVQLEDEESEVTSALGGKSMPLAEELDGQGESPIRRRVLLVANSLSIQDPRSVQRLERVCQFVRINQDHEIVRTVSWRDKERSHVQATKPKPIWLRFQSLLI